MLFIGKVTPKLQNITFYIAVYSLVGEFAKNYNKNKKDHGIQIEAGTVSNAVVKDANSTLTEETITVVAEK